MPATPSGFATIGAVSVACTFLERGEHRADERGSLEHDEHRQPAARREPAGRDEEQAPDQHGEADDPEPLRPPRDPRQRPRPARAARRSSWSRARSPEPEPEREEEPADDVARPQRGDDGAEHGPDALRQHEHRPVDAREHADDTFATVATATTRATSAIRSGAHAHGLPPQPERHVRRLHRLADDALRSARSRSSSTCSRSRAPNALERALRVVAAPVEAPVDERAARARAAAGTAPRRRASRRRSRGSSRPRTTRTAPAPQARGPRRRRRGSPSGRRRRASARSRGRPRRGGTAASPRRSRPGRRGRRAA